MSIVAVSGLHHRFGRHRVLNDLHLTLAAGECVALFGANGVGKSTLLAVLSTRYKVQRGTYRLDGLDVGQHGETVRGKLVYIGHDTHLYGHLSPMENLRFFSDLHGLNPDGETLLRTIVTVGLKKFAHQPTRWFSAGMKKRVALARVLLAKPKLLLLDEPYSALDAQGVAWLNDMLKNFLDQGGAMILATHDPERVAVLPHRPLVLDRTGLTEKPRWEGTGSGKGTDRC